MRENVKVGRFNLEKFIKTAENQICKTIKLHMNAFTSMDLYYFNMIPIENKTIFSRTLEGSFS